MKTLSFVITVDVRDKAHADGVTALLATQVECWRQAAQRVATEVRHDGWHKVPVLHSNSPVPPVNQYWRGGRKIGWYKTQPNTATVDVWHTDVDNQYRLYSKTLKSAAKAIAFIEGLP